MESSFSAPRRLSVKQVRRIRRNLFVERWLDWARLTGAVLVLAFNVIVTHDYAAAAGWAFAAMALFEMKQQRKSAFSSGWHDGAGAMLKFFSSPGKSIEELMLIVNSPPSWRQYRESLEITFAGLDDQNWDHEV